MELDVLGIRTNAQITGAGEPVLLLHGWGAQIESFAPVIFALQKYRRVIALDFPGFGKSGYPDKSWTVADYMEFTAAFLRQIGEKKVDIVCHSFGGRVTIMLAAIYPQLVGKIVFVDAAGIRPRRKPKYYIKIWSYKLTKKIARVNWLAGALKAIGVDVQKRIQSAGSSDYKALPDHMKKTFVNVVNQDLSGYLKDIKSPSLLIWGENDMDTPVLYGRKMEKEIADAGLVVLKNAGHFSYLDQFPQFIAVVNSFFGG